METKLLSTRILPLIILLLTGTVGITQDSLLTMLEDSSKSSQATVAVEGAFKAIHLVNTQTTESPGKKELNFIIMHRFGKLNDGAYNFFGLDNASIRLGLDYGISDRLGVGIGRSSFEKTFDGYVKYKLLQQSSGKKTVPINISLLVAVNHLTLRSDTFVSAQNKTSYITQAIIARKFSSALSLMVAPTYIHYNRYPVLRSAKEVFAATVGGRLKFTKRMAITAEYNYLIPGMLDAVDLEHSLSLGLDIETGGHVFQLVFTNSNGMIESQYIGKTNGSWGNGDIFFGFNVSRNFSFNKEKKKNW
ncbi:MAG: hypothetical protein JNK79_09225 [Chitinophagaceae bacterium]|nr:hypothetical protein [Chitinophagaceae bacterium]